MLRGPTGIKTFDHQSNELTDKIAEPYSQVMAATTEPTCKQILSQLKQLGKESHRKTFIRHGAPENQIFGVPVADLKLIQKKIKKNYSLAKELFDSGNADAQYLAGLIGDETKMTKSDLNKWSRNASWSMISTYSVPWVTSESKYAIDLATKWIGAKQEKVAMAGWSTLSSYVSITTDEELDLELLCGFLDRVVKEIHNERNDVKATMNGFVIAVGSFVPKMKSKALKAAKSIGTITVDQGDTACKTPDATESIHKVENAGRLGKKRKSARC